MWPDLCVDPGVPALDRLRNLDRPSAFRRSEHEQIVLLTELYPPAVGGSAVLFHEIYGRMTDVDVKVLTEARPRAQVSNDGHIELIEHPVGTHDWGVTRLSAARHHWRTAAALRGTASRRRSVVHCARAMPEGLAAWIASHFNGPRYVCWSHGEDLVTARSSREYEMLTTRVLRGAHICVANSHNTAGLIARFGVDRQRIKVVYPGVDASRFSPAVDGQLTRQQLGFSGDEIVLLSVGRLQRRKGHDLAIRTMARVRAQWPLLRYVIVGNGDDREYLEGLMEQHRVGDIVQLVGEVPADVLPKFYAACDIFLLPNRIEEGDIEGFGIVFLEAASSARAVIAGNSGGVAEAVADGSTGLLVSGTDEEELGFAIARLAEDPALRQKMGLAGRERVQRSFTWERAAAAMMALHLEAVTV